MVETESKLRHKVFTLQNSRKNVTAVNEWIKAVELKRSQLVSVSVSESAPQDGENVILVVFREHSKEIPSDVPLDTLDAKIFDPQSSWEDLYQEFENWGKGKDVLSLSHTAKNIGEGHIQTAWFTASTGHGPYNLQIFDNENVEWSDILGHAAGWMDSHIAPHQLVSISVFEENHPNENGKQILVVTHTAGKNPQEIEAKHRPAEGLYAYRTFKTKAGETSESHLNSAVIEAIEWISSKGPDAGAQISHAIDSRDHSLVVTAISWYAIHESNLKETAARPSECVCNIF